MLVILLHYASYIWGVFSYSPSLPSGLESAVQDVEFTENAAAHSLDDHPFVAFYDTYE